MTFLKLCGKTRISKHHTGECAPEPVWQQSLEDFPAALYRKWWLLLATRAQTRPGFLSSGEYSLSSATDARDRHFLPASVALLTVLPTNESVLAPLLLGNRGPTVAFPKWP